MSLFGRNNDQPDGLVMQDTPSSDLEAAEEYMRGQTGLYRHYNTRGVQDILRGRIGSQGRIADISDADVERIQQKLNRQRGW